MARSLLIHTILCVCVIIVDAWLSYNSIVNNTNIFVYFLLDKATLFLLRKALHHHCHLLAQLTNFFSISCPSLDQGLDG